MQNYPVAPLSVAPMLDWTDRHCRFFHRLLTQRARLYTEMVTTGAILHGDLPRHLGHDPVEHPLALQLGGSEPSDLAACAKLGAEWGYDEINLNCGCPSQRVQRGAFGACLMAEAGLVAVGVRAMQDAQPKPVSVKHRIGIDSHDEYGFVRDFVGTVARTGCKTFIVHARNAWLKGLSPKENREVPPLRYHFVYQLKREFPDLHIAINGGITTSEQVRAHLVHVDGAMLGREAYHNPWWLTEWDAAFMGATAYTRTREEVEGLMVDYMEAQAAAHGTHWATIARHMLGLRHGLPGARKWRRIWSDHRLKQLSARQVAEIARKHWEADVPAELFAAATSD